MQQAAVDIENLRKSIHDMIQRQNNEPENKIDAKKISDLQDNGYFETYAHYGIHHDMLSVSIFIGCKEALDMILMYVSSRMK